MPVPASLAPSVGSASGAEPVPLYLGRKRVVLAVFLLALSAALSGFTAGLLLIGLFGNAHSLSVGAAAAVFVAGAGCIAWFVLSLAYVVSLVAYALAARWHGATSSGLFFVDEQHGTIADFLGRSWSARVHRPAQLRWGERISGSRAFLFFDYAKSAEFNERRHARDVRVFLWAERVLARVIRATRFGTADAFFVPALLVRNAGVINRIHTWAQWGTKQVSLGSGPRMARSGGDPQV